MYREDNRDSQKNDITSPSLRGMIHEYIAIKNGNNTNLRDLTNTDKVFADANEDDVLMINATEEQDVEGTKLWNNLENNANEEIVYTYKCNDKDQSNEYYDLRDKITGNNGAEMPCVRSANWRMMRPNTNCQRPSGMPPLVPQHARPNGRSRRRNRSKKSQAFKTNFGKFANGFLINNGQNFRQQHHTSTVPNSNQKKIANTAFHITIPSVTPKTQPQVKANSEGIFSSVKTNEQNTLLNLCGLQNPHDIQNNMLPQIASKMLDMIKNNCMPVAHKPIYDLAVHKEICEIQKKPFMYKCGTVEVVSSDGPGIENIKVSPATTPLSLNCRFG